ncbi:Amidohydrolase [Duganella sp. CF458]|uniref:amidohydrolase family protein n=1 Tax=Duganella sp. CF458 TaxID=1884368 RepID=UPI0008EAB5A9|nr:amidohydrolase family protein [Duganella sp. CF458]SFG10913.1 Amidohydrolase [Duganella sp. CF458]
MNGIERRRSFLKYAGVLGLPVLSGCCLFGPREIVPYCPNSGAVSDLKAELTIDVHAHVFNGTDLPVKRFLELVMSRQVGVPGSVAAIIGALLQTAAWSNAPKAREELAELEKIKLKLATCGDRSGQPAISTLVQAMADRAFRNAVQELTNALNASPALKSARRKVQDQALALDMKIQAEAAVADEIELVSKMPTYGDYRKYLGSAAAGEGLVAIARISARGAIAFVIQNFQYRYVSVHDYLGLYNVPGKRVIDLLMPMMVDYDWWLAGGSPTASSLAGQVETMEQMAIVTGGRVHAFVPFDPLREVAFGLHLAPSSSLELVKDALDRGCIGVKLYPPMGFAALGNKRLQERSPAFWRQEWFDERLLLPDLGQRLDTALRSLYRHCVDNDIPIMAHTAQSNGPSGDFEGLAAAEYWACALKEFPGLRINFGHFGDTGFGGSEASAYVRAKEFAGLMQVNGVGRNAYADSGYFIEAVDHKESFKTAIAQLIKETDGKGSASLANRFMYGTDWEMTITQGHIESYLANFEEVFESKLVARKFFGENAADFAGLRNGQPTRLRLQKFYDRHQIPTPDWMRKIDQPKAA